MELSFAANLLRLLCRNYMVFVACHATGTIVFYVLRAHFSLLIVLRSAMIVGVHNQRTAQVIFGVARRAVRLNPQSSRPSNRRSVHLDQRVLLCGSNIKQDVGSMTELMLIDVYRYLLSQVTKPNRPLIVMMIHMPSVDCHIVATLLVMSMQEFS